MQEDTWHDPRNPGKTIIVILDYIVQELWDKTLKVALQQVSLQQSELQGGIGNIALRFMVFAAHSVLIYN